mmetsp:Transcript_50962/g.65271  ORF Transcript_50962/g.65271 Transcript_50962/m.65271 type:complete len:99 (+) Transcript_50962:224-520(+)
MLNPNLIIIKPNQRAHYKVHSNFPYHVQMGQGSEVTFSSLTGGPITLNGYIWGPGNLTMNCSVTAAAPIGSSPPINILTANSYQYEADSFEEVIMPTP